MGMPFLGDAVDIEVDPQFCLFEKVTNCLDEVTNWPPTSEISNIADRKSAGVEIDPAPHGIIC